MRLLAPAAGITAALLSSTCVYAVDLQGRLALPPSLTSMDVSVELQGSGAVGLPGRSYVGVDGLFSLHDIKPGTYELRVLCGSAVLKRELVSVQNEHQDLRIDIPEQHRTDSAEATVSVTRLKHRVPRDAQRAFQASIKSQESGNLTKAIAELEYAVRIDPQYVDAWNNLACQYLGMERSADALSAIRRALDLDHSSARIYRNLALALFQTHDPISAETAARKAIQLGDASAQVHFVLGIVLLNEGTKRTEAIAELRRASLEIPGAATLMKALNHSSEKPVVSATTTSGSLTKTLQ